MNTAASSMLLAALAALACLSCELRESRQVRPAYPPPGYSPPGYPAPSYPAPSHPAPQQSVPQGNYGAPPPQAQGQPGSGVVWTAVPPTNGSSNPTWGPTLTDIMQRKPARETGTWPDEEGTAHELTHSIGFELRLAATRTDRRATGFYVLGGRAAILHEPSFRKAQVAALIPPSLRRYRYDLYLAGQPGWDDRPLYVWDEWNAYINGATVAIERYQLGLEPHTTFAVKDVVLAVLEFTVYAAADILAAMQYEPSYLSQQPQSREFFAFNAERAMSVFQRGRKLPPFDYPDTDAYEATFKAAPEAEPLRASLRSLYGAGWTRRVFGF
ncbi:MAG: hypothetical protein R3B89_03845 [Polyangiaceae bacterium]